MQHLRIVGTQEDDGTTLLVLSDDSGAEHALPVDAALRSAVGRPSARPVAPDDDGTLSPRDIQAQLRTGATVDEVVEASGLERAHVERYAGPVQAERAYIAQRARSTEVAPVSSAEQHRLAFGDAPATLEAMVKVRLRAVEVDLSTVLWDAWRREDGLWQVVCWFDLSLSAQRDALAEGSEPPAEWAYSPAARQLTAQNAWAETLSALPSGNAKKRSGGRRLTAVDAPFDVEEARRAAGPAIRPVPTDEQDTSPLPGRPRSSGEEQPEEEGHEDLLDVLRSRRGQRLGTDADGDDRLARMLTRGEETESQNSAPQLRAVEDTHEKTDTEDAPEDESVHDGDEPAAEGTDAWGFSYEESDESNAPDSEQDSAPSAQPTLDENTFGESGEPSEPRRRRRSTSKKPSLPAWDDILFGGGKDS